jgi:hypothetical protein
MVTCELEASTPVAVVRVSGELAMDSALDVRDALRKALVTGPAAVLVDLLRATLREDIAVVVFAASARHAADWPGCPTFLLATDPRMCEVLERMAVHEVAPVYHDLSEAMAVAGAVRSPRSCRRRLPSTPTATELGRALVTEVCRGWGLDRATALVEGTAFVDDACLVVTELVSNAVRHGRGDLELMLTLRDRFLHIAVSDGSPVAPRRMTPDLDSTGGRGLLLLDAVTSGWGSRETAGGKVVWATLRRR